MTGELTVDGGAPRAARGRLGLLAQDPDSQLVMTRGRGRRRLRAGERRPARRPRSGRGWTRRWPPSASRTAGTGRPRRSPAGRSSGWCSPGRWPAGPGLLLLDEPTAQLDPAGAALVRSAVARVAGRPRGHAGRRRPRRRPVAAAGGPRRRGRRRADWSSTAATGARLPHRRPATCRPRRTDRSCSPREAAGFTYRGQPDRRRCRPRPRVLRGRARAGRHRARTAPASRRSPCCWPGCGRRRPAGSQAAAELAAGVRRGHREPHRWRAGELVSRIGTVFQHPEQQFLTGRVRDELALGPLRSGRHAAAARATADELLERLGLTAFADANPYTLSGGQQRRLSVATALATAPAGAGARRADVRPGRGDLAGAGHPAGRAAGRAAARSPWSPTTPTWWPSWPTTGCLG